MEYPGYVSKIFLGKILKYQILTICHLFSEIDWGDLD